MKRISLVLGAQRSSPANGAAHWRTWCRDCDEWHQHGLGEGNRTPHQKNTAYAHSDGFVTGLD